MYLQSFKLKRPKTIPEALVAIREAGDSAFKAGGTDLLVEMKKGLRHHTLLVSLNNIPELRILEETGGQLHLGAGLTHSEILHSQTVKDMFPGLHLAVSKIGSEQVRNSGTLGGNLCTAAACCDTAPVLIAQNAEVEMKSEKGTSTILLRDFFLHNRKTVLKKDEILTRVILPKAIAGTGVHYEKFTLREGSAVAVASSAVRVVIKKDIIEDCCIVLGAVAPIPIVSKNAMDQLTGKNISDIDENSEPVQLAGKAASDDSIPIDDVRGKAQYRRDVVNVITQRAILKAVKNAKDNQS